MLGKKQNAGRISVSFPEGVIGSIHIFSLSFPKTVIGNLMPANAKENDRYPKSAARRGGDDEGQILASRWAGDEAGENEPAGRVREDRPGRTGFTLIELLVVVLIIGILSAVAVPQYQTAVNKARFATVMPLVKALKEAEEVHYLANGSYTDDFSALDIALPPDFTETGICAGNGKMSLCLLESDDRVYGGSLVGGALRNLYVLYLDRSAYPGQAVCYAQGGDDSDALCKSLGGIYWTAGGSDGSSRVYKL